MPLRDGALQALDLVIHELDHLAAVQINHVIVMTAAIELEHRLSALEVMLADDARSFQLRQHAVHRGQPDILAVLDQMPVHILGGQMAWMPALEDAQDAHARMRHLQADTAQFLRWVHGKRPRANRPAVYHPGLSAPVACMHIVNRKWVFVGALALLAGGALGGCGIIYKPDVQQGNLLDKTKVQALKPGMTKAQVLSLIGQPSVISPFDGDRWDYVSTFQHRGGTTHERKLTLIFKNDALVRTEGDFFAETPQNMLRASANYEGNFEPSTDQDHGAEAAPAHAASSG